MSNENPTELTPIYLLKFNLFIFLNRALQNLKITSLGETKLDFQF